MDNIYQHQKTFGTIVLILTGVFVKGGERGVCVH